MDSVENNVYEITSEFAIRIVKLYKYLTEERHEYIMSKQLFRSGTSIGANAFEGKNAQSRADYLDQTQYDSMNSDWNRIMGVLTKIVKATKQ